MEAEIKKCIVKLFNTLSVKSDKETIEMFNKTIKDIKNTKTNIKDLEEFDRLINYKLQKGIKLLIKEIQKQPIESNSHKLYFIYINYKFLHNNIKVLCNYKEGASCCADKARYIVKMYLKYILMGEIPIFNPNIEKYYIPNFGNNQMWVNYCDSLYELYHGNTINYFKTYNNLIQSKIRKFKHTLHRWYIEFNNNKPIEFDQSWDKNDEIPLNSKGDFYIMHKDKVKDKNFDIYEPIDEEEKILYKNYVKVPKSEIKQIYKKSEETLV